MPRKQSSIEADQEITSSIQFFRMVRVFEKTIGLKDIFVERVQQKRNNQQETIENHIFDRQLN